MEMARRERAFTTFSHLTEVPMLLLSLAVIPVLLLPLVLDLSSSLDLTLATIDGILWAAFALELGVKTYLSPSRVRYLRSHWFDVVIVVIFPLRPLRILRSARLVTLLRSLRVIAVAARSLHLAREVLGRNGLQYALLIAMIVCVAAAGAVTIFERDNGGNIRNFGDGLWWSVTTITTVGYGDRFPTTPEGRAVGALLMLVGITLFGLVTASIAAFLVKPMDEPSNEPSLRDVMDQLHSIEAQLAELSESARRR